MGFPFENLYVDEPIPVDIQKYYQYDTDDRLRIHQNDWRGMSPIVAKFFGGAFSDDDTDIEFVTLYAVEKYGLGIDYNQITEMWKTHINRKIWVANKEGQTANG